MTSEENDVSLRAAVGALTAQVEALSITVRELKTFKDSALRYFFLIVLVASGGGTAVANLIGPQLPQGAQVAPIVIQAPQDLPAAP